ncbi:concanavalin A-like lectin/glucanase domain-containing protein [Pavlovales sp. CCMP2436]|nr:concanavalin A-like lectin/glucanase domain-containing protein [Pavlovales sp. CCMP2436]
MAGHVADTAAEPGPAVVEAELPLSPARLLVASGATPSIAGEVEERGTAQPEAATGSQASTPPPHPPKRARLSAPAAPFDASALELPAPPSRLLGPGERLVWADEFEYEGLPREDKWEFQVDANNWVHKPSHNEQQWYTSKRLENAHVSGGKLHICARREAWEGCPFTSARLRTKGRGDWLYGRIEVCAKLPPARRGLWPAIWLVSSDNRYGTWPKSGEIDIMENLGCEPGVLHGSVHAGAYNHRLHNHQMRTTRCVDAHDAFHVYSINWTAESIELFVNSEKFFEFKNEHKGSDAWPFDHPLHLILNVAVGGNWGAKDGIADDVCPASMEIAYVRVYQ